MKKENVETLMGSVDTFIKAIEGYAKSLRYDSDAKVVLQAIIDSDMYIEMKEDLFVAVMSHKERNDCLVESDYLHLN